MKSGWPTKTLAEVLEVQNGYAFDSKTFNALKGMPLIRIRDLKIATETETRFAGDYDKKYVVKAGDLLVGMDGEFACYEWKGSPALLNQRVCRLQRFSSGLLPRFLFYGVNSHLKAIEDVTGYATVKHISSKQILGIEFPLPPLLEQQRIVGILDEAFDGIATAKTNAGKNLQNTRALFESHLKFVFTQRGEGWMEKQLGEFCSFENGDRGVNYPSKSAQIATGIPFINAGHLTDQRIDFETMNYISRERFDLLGAGKIHPGDILFCLRGSLGKFASVGDLSEGAIASSLVIVRPEKSALKEFVLAYFRSHLCTEMIDKFKGGAAQPNLSAQSLKQFVVPVPPRGVQNSIVTKLDAISEETQRLESLYHRKLASLEALKKSLLHQGFTGEL